MNCLIRALIPFRAPEERARLTSTEFKGCIFRHPLRQCPQFGKNLDALFFKFASVRRIVRTEAPRTSEINARRAIPKRSW